MARKTRRISRAMTGTEHPNQVSVQVIHEDDGSYAITCSSLGVYSVGETLTEARRNFAQALDLHLDMLRENALKSVARSATA